MMYTYFKKIIAHLCRLLDFFEAILQLLKLVIAAVPPPHPLCTPKKIAIVTYEVKLSFYFFQELLVILSIFIMDLTLQPKIRTTTERPKVTVLIGDNVRRNSVLYTIYAIKMLKQ